MGLPSNAQSVCSNQVLLETLSFSVISFPGTYNFFTETCNEAPPKGAQDGPTHQQC